MENIIDELILIENKAREFTDELDTSSQRFQKLLDDRTLEIEAEIAGLEKIKISEIQKSEAELTAAKTAEIEADKMKSLAELEEKLGGKRGEIAEIIFKRIISGL